MHTKIVNHPAMKTKPFSREEDLYLVDQAILALKSSYSPYSEFKVGAAVLLSDHTIALGSNIENASYPLCLCAERTALAHAHMISPGMKIVAMAIVCKSAKHKLKTPGYPCGACRQVISEFEFKQASPIRILVSTFDKKVINTYDSIQDLLPHSFNGGFLV